MCQIQENSQSSKCQVEWVYDLASSNERQSEYWLYVSRRKLVEGAAKLLKPVKDTIKVWDTEITPTMQTVIEQLSNFHEIIG